VERAAAGAGDELAGRDAATMAVHVLGPVLMTELLRPTLRESDGPRVLLVTSGGMYSQKLRADDPEYLTGDYSPTTAYARSKRAQVEKLAEELLVKEVLFQSDVEKLIGKRPFRETKMLDVDNDGHHAENGAISEGVPPYDSSITNHPPTQA